MSVTFQKVETAVAVQVLSLAFTPRSAYRVFRDGQDLGIVVRSAIVPDWFAEGCSNANGIRCGYRSRERAAHALCTNADRRTAMLLTIASQIDWPADDMVHAHMEGHPIASHACREGHHSEECGEYFCTCECHAREQVPA